MPSSVNLPTGPVRAYLAAFGAAAVYVGRPLLPKREPIIAATSNLALAAKRLPHAYDLQSENDIVWTKSRKLANKLAMMAGRRRKRTGSDPAAAVVDAATIHGIAVTSHQLVMARARVAVDRAGAALKNGALKALNQRYAIMRAERAGKGLAVPRYLRVHADFRMALFRQLAAGGELDFAAAAERALPRDHSTKIE